MKEQTVEIKVSKPGCRCKVELVGDFDEIVSALRSFGFSVASIGGHILALDPPEGFTVPGQNLN